MNELAAELDPSPQVSSRRVHLEIEPNSDANQAKQKKYKLSESTTESIEDQRLKLARISKGLITFVVISQVLICILIKALFFAEVQNYPGEKK